jgi:outer membrane biosynthesis protein TonB
MNVIPETQPTPSAEISTEIPAQQDAEHAVEPVEVAEVVEPAEVVAEAADDKSRTAAASSAKPKRKSAPRKAAGTKTLVVFREGRVQYVDPDTVLVIDLDEAASPDTDVHDVVDRLTELRDAMDCPGKSDAVRALTDLIREKALG